MYKDQRSPTVSAEPEATKEITLSLLLTRFEDEVNRGYDINCSLKTQINRLKNPQEELPEKGNTELCDEVPNLTQIFDGLIDRLRSLNNKNEHQAMRLYNFVG